MAEVWYCGDCMELTAGPEMHMVTCESDGSQLVPVKNYGIFHAAFQKLVIDQ